MVLRPPPESAFDTDRVPYAEEEERGDGPAGELPYNGGGSGPAPPEVGRLAEGAAPVGPALLDLPK